MGNGKIADSEFTTGSSNMTGSNGNFIGPEAKKSVFALGGAVNN